MAVFSGSRLLAINYRASLYLKRRCDFQFRNVTWLRQVRLGYPNDFERWFSVQKRYLVATDKNAQRYWQVEVIFSSETLLGCDIRPHEHFIPRTSWFSVQKRYLVATYLEVCGTPKRRCDFQFRNVTWLRHPRKRFAVAPQSDFQFRNVTWLRRRIGWIALWFSVQKRYLVATA